MGIVHNLHGRQYPTGMFHTNTRPRPHRQVLLREEALCRASSVVITNASYTENSSVTESVDEILLCARWEQMSVHCCLTEGVYRSLSGE